jgi:predicted transcriptional regulator
MKVVGIDVETLEKRKAEIAAELDAIDKILTIAKNGAALPGIHVESRPRHRQVNNSGIRRICLLSLFTGTCKAEDIARTANQDLQTVRSCLNTCLSVGIVLEKDGLFSLTNKGRTMAQWHQANPRFMTYHGPNVYNNPLREVV